MRESPMPDNSSPTHNNGSPASSAPLEALIGVLERVTYHNEENGYTVGRLAVEGARDLVTLIGNFSNPVVGEQLTCEGRWTAHKEFGRQFAVERYHTSKPATAFAIEKYLGSGLIKGVGPVMAKRMVDLFGLETLEVIENDPRTLLRVEGIGEKRVTMIQKAWDEQREIRSMWKSGALIFARCLSRVRLVYEPKQQTWEVLTSSNVPLRQDWNESNFLTLAQDLLNTP